MANYGHRAGGGETGYYKDLPENSIEALRTVLKGRAGSAPLQNHKKFEYLEFDIRETYDNHIILIHDETLDRVIDWTSASEDLKKILKDSDVLKRHQKKTLRPSDLKVNKLKLAEIQKFNLKNGSEPVPLLEDFLSAAELYGLRKPLVAEIKKLDTDTGRLHFINMISAFRERYMETVVIVREKGFDFPEDTNVMSFAKHFKASFGDTKAPSRVHWCRIFKNFNFAGVFTPLTHSRDNCNGFY